MAWSGIFLSVFFPVNLWTSFGASLHENAGSRLLRTAEATERSVELAATGEFIRREKQHKHSDTEYCDIDFVWGLVNTIACDDRADTNLRPDTYTNHSDLTRAKCKAAAGRAGAAVPVNFEITQSWEPVRPDGCFMYPCDPAACSSGTCDQCYYYNENGDSATAPKGVPVCERPRYILGKSVDGTEVNAANNPMCENDFQSANGQYRVVGFTAVPGASKEVIAAAEDECRKAATCLDLCEGAEFTVTSQNSSKQLEYPPGCFKMNSTVGEPCVFFNPAPLGAPPNVLAGIPICIVANPDNVASSSLPAGYTPSSYHTST